MKYGIGPTHLDPRDYSYHRSFGSVAPPKWPASYNVDKGGIIYDQNADGYSWGCTGYTQADNASNRDGIQYKPPYTYLKTCYMENHEPTTGCDIRNSMKSTRVYGTQAIHETTDQEAQKHLGGKYWNIYDDGGMDWFDSARSALMKENVPLSAGTPWFPEWQNNTGVLPSFVYSGNPYSVGWHNFAIVGWMDIAGEPHLIAKPWQGRDYGHNGYVYLRRELFNRLINIPGSSLFVQLTATPGDVYSIKLDVLQTVLIYIHRIFRILRPLN